MSGVVVTGIGMVTSVGPSADENRLRAETGGSGIGPLRRFEAPENMCAASAEVEDSRLNPRLRTPKNQKFMNRSVLCALQAAQEATAASGVDLSRFDPFRIAIHTGSGQTGLESADFFPALDMAWSKSPEQDYKLLGGRPSRLIDRYFSLRTLSNVGLAFLSTELDAQGPSSNFVHGDTASALAISTAYFDLVEDRCDIAIAGGYDSLVTESTYLAYEKVGLLSHLPPEEALRPFDRRRDGIVLGEGAGYLVMERRPDAEKRGAPIFGEILGFGSSMDTADSLVSGPPAPAVINEVLGGIRPDLIVAHGISTLDGDRLEGSLLSSILGKDVPVTAFKGLVGYTGAAAAAVELGITLLALYQGVIPPIAHHTTADPEIELDLVAHEARRCKSNSQTVLCLNRSWAGQQTAVLLRAETRR